MGKSTQNGTFAISASGDKYAIIFAAPKTGTIDRLRFRTGTITTGSASAVDVRLETVTASTGDPTGALAAANTNGAQVIASANDDTWFEVTLTAGYAATVGEILAIVVVNPASPVNGQLNATTVDPVNFGYSNRFAAAAWTHSGTVAFAGVRYSDGDYPYVPSMTPEGPVNGTFSSASAGDERGNLLTLPFGCTVWGFWLPALATKNAQDVVLYDAASGVLLTRAFDLRGVAAAAGAPYFVPFSSTVNLVAGQQVRIVQKPGASTVSQITVTAPAGLGVQFPGGLSCVYTQRTDGGAWAPTADKMALIGLMLSHVDNGARAAAPLVVGQRGTAW